MSYPLLLVDVFIDQPFSGNPAGVCILDKTHLRAQQASPRGGLLTLDWKGERVLLSGKARTMLTGEFYG